MKQLHLTIATRNPHKTREIAEILGRDFIVQDLAGRGDIPDVAETGSTFDENARLKAVGVSERVAGVVLADDSGLEVEALAGAPGVYSARYAGEQATDREKVTKLLHELRRADPEKRNRAAQFRCVIAIARDGECLAVFSGQVNGTIVDEPRGGGGFGYDPVFLPEGFTQTFAQLPGTTKNKISHRARALTAALPLFERLADG